MCLPIRQDGTTAIHFISQLMQKLYLNPMNKTFPQILRAGLLVGTLDIAAAMLYFFISTGNKDVLIVVKYIASGVFGKTAFSGGAEMIAAGFLFHYLIALSFTAFFFWIYPHIKTFAGYMLLSGIAYGLFVWAVMNLVIVPLSRIGHRPFKLVDAVINLLILIVCMGIPLSIMANNFYRRKGPPKEH
jgi:hypothetical protein